MSKLLEAWRFETEGKSKQEGKNNSSMNIVKYNIRGGRNSPKRRRVQECAKKGRADLCSL